MATDETNKIDNLIKNFCDKFQCSNYEHRNPTTDDVKALLYSYSNVLNNTKNIPKNRFVKELRLVGRSEFLGCDELKDADGNNYSACFDADPDDIACLQEVWKE